MWVVITSTVLWPTVSDFVDGPNLTHRFSFLIWRNYIRLINNMCLKPAANSPVNFIGRVMLLLELGSLHVRVHFGVKDILAVPLLI